jgi:hypothetical protein
MRYTTSSFYGTLALALAAAVAFAGFRSLQWPSSINHPPSSISKTVWITATGTHYHNAGCRYLTRSGRAIPLVFSSSHSLVFPGGRAQAPCSICNP